MTKADIAELLTMIAAFDQRTIGEADVEAWHAVAVAQSWRPAWARRAVIEFHSQQADRGRIRPAHITDLITQRRDQIRKELFKSPLQPPAELDGDPAREKAWRLDYAHQQVTRALDGWAGGRTIQELTA